MVNRDLQNRLLAWGRWVRHANRPPNGYPRCAPFARQIVNPGDNARPPLPDDDLMERINREILELERRCAEGDYRHIALVTYYRDMPDTDDPSDKAVARELGINRHKLRTARIAAESWIDARIN